MSKPPKAPPSSEEGRANREDAMPDDPGKALDRADRQSKGRPPGEKERGEGGEKERAR